MSKSLDESFSHLKSSLHKLFEDVGNSDTVREGKNKNPNLNVSNTRKSGIEVISPE